MEYTEVPEFHDIQGYNINTFTSEPRFRHEGNTIDVGTGLSIVPGRVAVFRRLLGFAVMLGDQHVTIEQPMTSDIVIDWVCMLMDNRATTVTYENKLIPYTTPTPTPTLTPCIKQLDAGLPPSLDFARHAGRQWHRRRRWADDGGVRGGGDAVEGTEWSGWTETTSWWWWQRRL
ncbi:hypothetical protein CHU98_g383 [Xylaria longipes]|nr:hypothetical protein CHU98_g383 [Xylaria longipes]